MKVHTPLFIIGLLIFITPIVGLPDFTEMMILAIFGISIMIITSTHKLGCSECGNFDVKISNSKVQIFEDKKPSENQIANEGENQSQA